MDATSENGRDFKMGDHEFKVGVFPVGIEPQQIRRQAKRAAESSFMREFDQSMQKRKLVIGVDRLDYSKGILNRVAAFERFLEKAIDWRGRVTYLQIAPKSREDIPEYHEMYQQVSSNIGQINGRFGDVGWVPVRYVNRNYKRLAVAGMFERSRVGLVTPLRDGMNLVAKEFIAAQNPDDPGVLVLSEFAGAAAEMKAALLVNPHDVDAVAAAISTALEMSRDERIARHREMMERLEANDIRYWAKSFIEALTIPQRTDHWLSNWGVTDT